MMGMQTETLNKDVIMKDLDLSIEKKDLAGTPTLVDPEVEERAEKNVGALLNFDKNDLDAQDNSKRAIEVLGIDLQRKCAKKSSMLQGPMKDLASKSEDGGTVASALTNLKLEVESLDPAKFDLSPGWFSRTLGWLPFVGSPLKKYFTKFESAQTIIDAIIKSLEEGRDMLKRDNITLLEDQKGMRQMTIRLEQIIKMAQLMDNKIAYKLEREIEDEGKKKFVEEELLFPLRQRTMDLSQQLAVNQQGVLALEVIIRNNKELIKGVERSLSVTIVALEVAVTVAMALENQKIVLDKVNALAKTTNNLIAGTAQRLKTQGVEIQKQASSAALDMDTLKNAFKDINEAMADISNFRRESLPKMADTILEMNKMTSEAEKNIKDMEKGNVAQENIRLLEE